MVGQEKYLKSKDEEWLVTDKPQTTSKELQEHLAADGVIVHRSTVQRTLHKDSPMEG